MGRYSFRRNWLTYTLIAVNFVIFLYSGYLSRFTFDTGTMLSLGAEYWPYTLEGKEYWRLLTACFLHYGFSHLLSNMLFLFYFGCIVEPILGHGRFGILYLLSGIGANVLSALFYMKIGDAAVCAGASGACFGVDGMLLCLALLLPQSVRDQGINPRRVPISVILNLVLSYAAVGVDNVAHIGGLILGFLLTGPFCFRKRNE